MKTTKLIVWESLVVKRIKVIQLGLKSKKLINKPTDFTDKEYDEWDALDKEYQDAKWDLKIEEQSWIEYLDTFH